MGLQVSGWSLRVVSGEKVVTQKLPLVFSWRKELDDATTTTHQGTHTRMLSFHG